MKEIKAIIRAYDQAVVKKKQAALVTVVQLEGSSYRRPGARMLVTDDGQLTGAISGGCLEGDALQKALLVLHLQEPRIVTYDTHDEEENGMGAQLGCAGIIQVLIEPIQVNDPNNPIELLRKSIRRRQSFALITVYCLEQKQESHWGTCCLLEENGAFSEYLPEPDLKSWLALEAKSSLQQRISSRRTRERNGKQWTFFIEYVPPPISLWVIGAGNDVLPLVNMADHLGWETTLIDGRPNLANTERFQSACQIVVARPEEAILQLRPDHRTAAALMTHNFHYDKGMLIALLTTIVPYIGVLGPRKKLDKMLEALSVEGIPVDPGQLNRIYGPVGLEIGAETADEIALSILAEIQAVMAGKTGHFLRSKMDVIHDQHSQLVDFG